MKRSEMLEILKDSIVNNLTEVTDVTDEDASMILARLEVAGMMPPKHYNVDDSFKEEPYMPGYHGLNGWEPEDEKK